MRSWCIGGPPLVMRSLQWLWQNKNKSTLCASSTTSSWATSITIANSSQTLLSAHSMENSKCFSTVTTGRCSVSKPESEASSTVVRSKAHKSKVNFCQFCGGPTKECIPEGEEKTRAVCTLCGKVYYENPKMVVGCLVEHNNKVLLCKRKIQPSYGLWTLPAGFMELGESAADGAVRETMEEACAEVEVVSPFAQLDIPLIGQSYVIFRAQFKHPYFSAGSESLECALFSLDEIPFESLAFSSIFVTLKMYVEDAKAGKYSFHYCVIDKRPGASPSDPHGFIVCQHACS